MSSPETNGPAGLRVSSEPHNLSKLTKIAVEGKKVFDVLPRIRPEQDFTPSGYLFQNHSRYFLNFQTLGPELLPQVFPMHTKS